MDTTQFIALVAKLRESQRKFFRTRSGLDLRLCKQLEKKVDEWLKKYHEDNNIPTQQTLFP